MNAMYLKQLDNNADDFVNAYRDASSEEISRIVAGMTAIIEGNEASYESMKNQRWFERIWYGLTGKNKATVKEMQANRDQLTKYTVQILVKMNDVISDHSECIYDLYRALSIVRFNLDQIVDGVSNLARVLDEKISSVDNYNYILNEIRNNKFSNKSQLISLIDIMSLIDYRTVKDPKKMLQLKETMELQGFDFTKQEDMTTLFHEVLSLPDEKVGRIQLFCQSLSSKNRLLAYIAFLTEKYFYMYCSSRCDFNGLLLLSA